MSTLLLIVGIYAAVFITDYLFYVKQGVGYQFVSRRTFSLFIGGQMLVAVFFLSYLEPYFTNWRTELVFLGVLTVVLAVFARILVKEGLLVCQVTSRTERCLTLPYVLVKGAEIVFQQLCYLVIALLVVELIGFGLLGFLLYTQVLLIMHTPVILSCNKAVAYKLTLGLGLLAAPLLYIFVELQYFFPAVYLHVLLYVFYWATFADFEHQSTGVVENRG